MLLLEGYEAQELSPALRARLDSHLGSCPSCAVHAGEMASFGAFLAEARDQAPLGFEEALETVRQRTLRSVRQEGTQETSIRAWLGSYVRVPVAVPVAIGAALLLLVLINPLVRTQNTPLAPDGGGQASLMPPSSEGGSANGGSSTDFVSPDETNNGTAATRTAREGVVPQGTGQDSSPQTSARIQGLPQVSYSEMTAQVTVSKQAGSYDFVMVRSGAEIRIEWPHNGHQHRIRKAQDPVSVNVAGGQVVHGGVWSDSERQLPGSVTFYLVD